MNNTISAWHFELCDAIAANDRPRARLIRDKVMADAELYDPRHPVDRAMGLFASCHAGDRAGLEAAEDSLAQGADTLVSRRYGDDARAASYLLAGLMRLGDDTARAAQHFENALRDRPDFLPARVELECIRRGADRMALFNALGTAPPRAEWRYLLAASELALDAGIEAVETPGAICMRGLCTQHTAAMLRLYRWLNPGVRIILATWKHTELELLRSVQHLAQTVVIEDTDNPGSQNKNRQMLQARAALLTAQPNAASVLMTRTDLALFSPNIIPTLIALQAAYPPRSAALNQRLVIPDVYTCHFRDYQLSDIMCFGTFDDVVRFWGAPFEGPDAEYMNTEIHLGWHFAEQVLANDEPRQDRRIRHHALLRDCVIVRDLDWLGGFWLRHPEVRNGSKFHFGNACVSQGEWERIYFARESGADLFSADAVLMREVLGAL